MVFSAVPQRLAGHASRATLVMAADSRAMGHLHRRTLASYHESPSVPTGAGGKVSRWTNCWALLHELPVPTFEERTALGRSALRGPCESARQKSGAGISLLFVPGRTHLSRPPLAQPIAADAARPYLWSHRSVKQHGQGHRSVMHLIRSLGFHTLATGHAGSVRA
jgi:hypothetical protein